jgi:hypothetical protein
MRRRAIAATVVLLALASAPAMAQKVYVDYDTTADFSSFKTFAWVDTDTTSLKADYPEVDGLIKNNITYYLVKAGLKEDPENPDLKVTYHTSSNTQTQTMSATFGYGYGTGWSWGPYWAPAIASGTISTDFKKGMLVIDIWNPRTREAVFRGTAVESIGDDPLKTVKKIDKSIDKIVQAYKKMHAHEASKPN